MGKNKKEVKLKVRLNKVKKDKIEKENNRDKIQNNFEEARSIDKKEKKIYSSQEEKIEHDKKLMMWAGVSFFMILFIILWLANMKNVFKQVEQGRDNSEQFEWNKITDEFSQTMGQIRESLNELKQAALIDNTSSSTAENLNNYLPANEDASTTQEFIDGGAGSAGKEQDNILELKERLKDLEDNLDNKN